MFCLQSYEKQWLCESKVTQCMGKHLENIKGPPWLWGSLSWSVFLYNKRLWVDPWALHVSRFQVQSPVSDVFLSRQCFSLSLPLTSVNVSLSED